MVNLDIITLSLLAAIFSSLSISILSPFIALKKISYFGHSISHIAFAGISFAILFNLNINLVNIIFITFIAILIGYLNKKVKIEHANITTIFLTVAMATGVILLSFKKDYTIDITSYLFGNILLIANSDLIYLFIQFIINLLFLLLFFKELFYLTYNEEVASIYKIPVMPIYYIFLILVSINIILSVKIVGVIIISSLLILPGITALNFTRKIKTSIILSVVFAIISSILGFYTSYIFDLPSGATIVIVMFIIFLISIFYKITKSKYER